MLGGGDAGRELHYLEVAEMDLSSFRLEAKVAFFILYVADAVDELAVDRELDHPVHADDVVHVPLPFPLATVLEGLAPTPRGLSGVALSPPAPNSSP